MQNTTSPSARPSVKPAPAAPHYRSKTLAAWLALFLGPFGLHRLYLYGMGDFWGWLHLPPTLLGLFGALRLADVGQDDRLAWLLIPVLGLMISLAMLTAIVYALTSDERWHQKFNPGRPGRPGGWAAVIAAVVALLVGGTVLMGSIAYGGQKFFEWQLRAAADGPQKSQRLSP